jgi:hypothetical protein
MNIYKKWIKKFLIIITFGSSYTTIHALNYYKEAVSHVVNAWSDLEMVTTNFSKEVDVLDQRSNNQLIINVLCSILGRLVTLNHAMKKVIEEGKSVYIHNDTEFWVHVLNKLDNYIQNIKERHFSSCIEHIEKEFSILNAQIQNINRSYLANSLELYE